MANTEYYGESTQSNIRGVLIYNTVTTDTQVTLTIQSQLEFKSMWGAGYRVDTLIEGNVVDTATGYASSGYSNWTKCADTGEYIQTFERTNVDQIVEIGSKYYGQKVDGAGSIGSNNGDIAISIAIPAKDSNFTPYIKVNNEWKKALFLYTRTENGWKIVRKIKSSG